MDTKNLIIDAFNNKITSLGLKQKIIAEKIDVTEDRLSRILAGRSNMFAEEMIKLCVILDIDPNTFRKSA